MKRLLPLLLLAALPCLSQSLVRIPGPGGASGTVVSGTVNIGLPLNDGGNDSGNSNVIEFLPIKTPNTTSTVTSESVWWGTVSSNTWGVAVYTDNGGTPVGGTLLCSSIVTSTPSSGFNTRNPAGCGTLSSNTTYWLAQITGSNTLQNGRTSGDGTRCGASGFGAFQSNAAQGSTTFPSTGPASSAYSGCPNMYITLSCTGACGATLEYWETALPTGHAASTTNSFTASILTGDTHPVILLSVQADGSTGSHTMSCTLNGVSMTQVVAPVAGSGATLFGSVFLMVAPPTGNQTITCTSSLSGSDWMMVAYMFAGINQTGTVGNTWRSTPDTAVDGGAGGSPASVTLASSHSASGDIVFNWISFDILSYTSDGPPGKTGIYHVIQPNSSSVQVAAQIAGGTGASLTMSWPFLPTTGTWSTMAFSLVPG